MAQESENVPAGAAEGIERNTGTAVSAVAAMAEAIINEAESKLSTLQSMLYSIGHSAIEDGLIAGMRDAFDGYSVANSVSSMIDNISSTLNNRYWDIYNAGSSLGNAFKSGFENTYIRVPHIETAWWDTITLGNGFWYQVPHYSVNWYANGGLFTKATIAGFGEAGNEAALPLENKRVMSKIANAIVESGGGSMGMNSEDMQEAVMTGVAMALAQNPQVVEVVVDAVLKTNDEAIARSAARGQAKLDQRYNATPQYN